MTKPQRDELPESPEREVHAGSCRIEWVQPDEHDAPQRDVGPFHAHRQHDSSRAYSVEADA